MIMSMTQKENSSDLNEDNKLNLTNIKIPTPKTLNAENTIQIYELLRPILPITKIFKSEMVSSVREILHKVDGLILDGYGIVNVGDHLVPGFLEFFTELCQRELPFVILTNGASQNTSNLADKYKSLGLQISEHDIISSRDVLEEQLIHKSEKKIMRLSTTTAPLKHCFDLNQSASSFTDAFRQAEAFAFMGSIDWTEWEQSKFEAALRENPRPVFVANPDVSAPQKKGFSAEPGYWVTRAMKQTQFPVEWYGKPHSVSFQKAMNILQEKTDKHLQKSRVAMIGDSLHTDILGANAAGLISILVSNYGLMRRLNVLEICEQISIYPDFIAPIL